MDRIKLKKANDLADEISRISVMLDAMTQKDDELLFFKVAVYDENGYEKNTLEISDADVKTVDAIKSNLKLRLKDLEKEFESL